MPGAHCSQAWGGSLCFDQVDDHLQTSCHLQLDTLSPAYRDTFRNAPLPRLEALKRDGQS